jgi:hypothetical protein
MSTSNIVATGGTVKRIGLTSHLTHTFTESGDFTVHRPVIVRYLIVGGRGGGPAPDEKSTLDQEGGVGDVVEGTSTYQLQPGTYTVTVGPRSTEFTEKQIAGTGYSSRPMGTYSQYCKPPWDSTGDSYSVYYNANTPTAWTANQRNFSEGKPSSIGGVAMAKGGVPHPGISNQPRTTSSQFSGLWKGYYGQATGNRMICLSGNGGNYHGIANMGMIDVKLNSSWPNNVVSQTAYNMVDDKTWKDAIDNQNLGRGAAQAKANAAAQNESDITGTKAMYGLKPTVVIRYDESTAGAALPATPSPDTIAQIEKAYAEKMQKLKDAAEAEKKALESQNAAAAAEASKLKDQLITELNGLKTQYDQLKTTATDATGKLEAAKTELSQIKTEYASKMTDLKAAQKAELDALNSKNATALEAARLAQQQLISEMTTLKTQYDSLLANSSMCPTIPEGSIVVDAKDGQLYRYDMAQLRPMSNDTYRVLGSPAYTTYPSGSLDKCPRGPVYIVQTTTTEPPATTGPSGPPVFDGSLFIVVHGKSWTERGELKVIATRFGGATLESFKFKDFAQVFLINNDGFIRNLADRGLYLTSKTGCLATGMTVDAPDAGWTFKKSAGSKYAYGLVSNCGSALSAAVGAREPVLEKTDDDWFIIPVGKATM